MKGYLAPSRLRAPVWRRRPLDVLLNRFPRVEPSAVRLELAAQELHLTLQSNQIRRIGLLCRPEPVDRLHELFLSIPQLVLRGEGVKAVPQVRNIILVSITILHRTTSLTDLALEASTIELNSVSREYFLAIDFRYD